jgi:hypothetical protein
MASSAYARRRSKANGANFERHLMAVAREVKKIVGDIQDTEGVDAAVARLTRY